VTIATGLLTAAVGITGNILTTKTSTENSIQQRQSENERSATEFLRKQRQEAYFAFGSEVNATFAALREDSRKFKPFDPPPTAEDYQTAEGSEMSHFEKMSAAGINLGLVASQDVCDAANREWSALTDASDRHVGAAEPYAKRQKPPDDGYRKIWITNDELGALQDMMHDFVTAARDDLADLAFRKPARNCF
jgi:hypothetical protein